MPDSRKRKVAEKAVSERDDECAQLRAQLEAVRRQYHFAVAMLNEVPNMIFAKDAEARFCFFNKAYEHFFGMSRDDFLHKRVLDLVYLPEDERRRYHQEDCDAIATGSVIHVPQHYSTYQGEFDTLYWSKGIRVPETGERGLIGTIVDISDQKRLEGELSQKVSELENMRQELEVLVRIDPLTNLPNRRPFDEALCSGIGMARRHNYPLSLLMGDIDFFKKVNDTFGHDVGDEVLCSVANILRESCRTEDLVARVGGEEFVLLMQVTDLYDAERVAQRICDRVRSTPVLPDGRPVTMSFGATQYVNGEEPADFVKRADEGLYRAKQGGRDRVCVLCGEESGEY